MAVPLASGGAALVMSEGSDASRTLKAEKKIDERGEHDK